eukprot:78413-Lingulodinium_polyedra.AAC.1
MNYNTVCLSWVLLAILLGKFEGQQLQAQFQQWEIEIVKFEGVIGKPFYDEVNIGLVAPSTTGKSHEHICPPVDFYHHL